MQQTDTKCVGGRVSSKATPKREKRRREGGSPPPFPHDFAPRENAVVMHPGHRNFCDSVVRIPWSVKHRCRVGHLCANEARVPKNHFTLQDFTTPVARNQATLYSHTARARETIPQLLGFYLLVVAYPNHPGRDPAQLRTPRTRTTR